jgi:site-specific DNA-methyltransferase (adenine-specific)
MTAYLNVVTVGDALECLKAVPDSSIDACCTDPPYGLTVSCHDPVKVMREWIAGEPYIPKSQQGFMYQEWDAFVPGPDLWKEVHRILKPGAWCLVFAGTRTQDWMGMALRFAGFEIVDSITYHYASGFPKSLDISKAVDAHLATGRSDSLAIQYANDELREGGERWRDRNMKKRGGGIVGAEVVAGRVIRDEPATDEGKRWRGFGTAIKPATEPIIVARKQIEGTYVENILKYGTGALNIDECRVGTMPYTQEEWNRKGGTGRCSSHIKQVSAGMKQAYLDGKILVPDGRWPANVVFSHHPDCREAETCVEGCPVRELDTQSDGASRFFFTTKAAIRERWGYCTKCCVVFPRSVGGYGAHEEHREKVVEHPTQKPQDLIEYLVRLITPPGGVVLDPFLGAGTTAVAAKRQGYSFIACDLSADYARIAEARLAATTATVREAVASGAYFCPGCKARGEIKLIDKSVVERMEASGKKVTCPRCLKRYSYDDLSARKEKI